jgi:hypothetical protein
MSDGLTAPQAEIVRRKHWHIGCIRANHIDSSEKTGLCDTCRVPETVEYYLLTCPAGPAGTVKEQYDTLGQAFDIESILDNQAVIELVRSERTKKAASATALVPTECSSCM